MYLNFRKFEIIKRKLQIPLFEYVNNYNLIYFITKNQVFKKKKHSGTEIW